MLCIIGILSLHAQEANKQKTPNEQIIVNKQYDDQGNLISFDSTYVHQWSSDSTFNFSFGNGFDFGDNSMHFANPAFIDSLLQDMFKADALVFSPFDDEFLGGDFPMFPDSTMNNRFYFHSDSLNQSFFNHPNHLFFHEPDLKQLKELFNRQMLQFKQHFDFQSDKQKKEWEELIKKQKKEQMEFMKKWKNDTIK
ncbi:MAG: hypothetical protein CR996_01430 [Draconibacterium sp.]|nr:MAG: hypothetical protein CR996_01430 [Draconibacterium sp.]PIF05570.1 MAG: hypothetical protein CSA36_06145 [Draconibacterium sp.]